MGYSTAGLPYPELEPRATLDLFTAAQIADLAAVISQINAEYNGYGQITITLRRGQVYAIGSSTERRYDLERK